MVKKERRTVAITRGIVFKYAIGNRAIRAAKTSAGAMPAADVVFYYAAGNYRRIIRKSKTRSSQLRIVLFKNTACNISIGFAAINPRIRPSVISEEYAVVYGNRTIIVIWLP